MFPHRDRVHGIVTRDNHDAGTVGHHNVATLSSDVKSRPFDARTASRWLTPENFGTSGLDKNPSNRFALRQLCHYFEIVSNGFGATFSFLSCTDLETEEDRPVSLKILLCVSRGLLL